LDLNLDFDFNCDLWTWTWTLDSNLEKKALDMEVTLPLWHYMSAAVNETVDRFKKIDIESRLIHRRNSFHVTAAA